MNLAKNLRLVACFLLATLSGCIEDKSRHQLSDGPDPSATLGTVTANPSTGVLANGVAVSAITVTVVDDTGAPLVNHVVQLTASGTNNTIVQPAVTNASGVATGTISSTRAETKTITATIDPGANAIVLAQQPAIEFIADAGSISAVVSTASAAPATGVIADGATVSTITVTVRDQNGNGIAAQVVQLAASGSNNTLVQPAVTNALGIATGTLASTTAEIKTITATINPGANQIAVAQQPTVEFIGNPNTVSATISVVTASPATGVLANGSAISTVTVILRDSNGNPVVGQAVLLSSTGSNNTLVQPGVTDAGGVTTGTIASTTAETKTITATVNPGAGQVVLAQQPTVQFVADPSNISALLSTATAAPTLGVLADGVTISTITVTVRDANGNPVAGQAVDLAASGSNNTLVQPGLTDASGVATGTIASTMAETKTITATINPGASQIVVAQQPTVQFVGSALSISGTLSTASASPASGVIANGSAISTITVTVRDSNGNPVAGQAVQLASSGSNNILVQPIVTDASGVATGTIASTMAETKTITATINPGVGQIVVAQQPTVDFVADPNNISAVLTTATASPASGVIADGSAISTITVTVRDSNGNPVAGQAVALASSGSNNILVQPGVTDASGVASGTIASLTAETKIITAIVNPGVGQVVVAQQPTVDFVGDPNNISAVLTTATAAPATGVIANGLAISTITVTVRDSNGNPVAGQAVDLAASGSNNVLVQPGLTDAFGVASGTIASITAELKTITATVNPGAGQVVVAQQPTVDFVGDPSTINALLSSATAAPTLGVLADGLTTSTITVTVRDQNGNPVSGQVVDLAATGSNNILVQPGLTDALGVASGTIASTTAEIKTITATINPGASQVVVPQQPTVEFVSNPANISALLSTATAAPAAGVLADGSAISTITVTVRDSNGNPVAGQAVQLDASGSNNILVQPGVTDASGVASGTIASITAETKTITATVNPGASQVVVAQQPTVEFVGDPSTISALQTSATASPATGVIADGLAVSTITVTVRDSNGNPVAGQAVDLAASGSNNVLVQPGLTDAFGVASGTIASITAELKTITATVNPGASQVVVAQQPTVQFVGDPNNISGVLTSASASPATGVLANGSAISTITVTVLDINGNPVVGQAVDLAATGSNNILAQPGLTDAFGVASGTIASTTAETKTITATVNPGASQVVVAQQPTVEFVPDANNISAVLTTATASPATGVIADGAAISTITVTVRDSNGNPVPGQAVELASSGSNNILIQPGLTDAFGVASGTIASITAELKTITATVNPGASQIVVAQQPTVEFVGDPSTINALLTTATASPAIGVIADGSAVSTITVTVRDSNGNPVAGQAVDLAASGSNNILVQPGLTDAFGVASGTIASTSAETKTITATVNPGASQVVVAQQPTVEFVADPNNISAVLSSASASPATGVLADGSAISTITVTLRDSNGNPVAGQAVQLSSTGSNNILVQPGLTDAFGVASGTIASTTAETKIITATVNPGASQVVVAQQPSVEFVADPNNISAVLTTASASPATGVIADGLAVSTITVTVRDSNGNPVAGQVVDLAASGSNNVLVQPGLTDAFGVASGTIASTSAEIKTIIATVNPGASQVVVAQQPTVQFVGDPNNISGVLTTASASPASGVLANGSAVSTITVTVRDSNGNPVEGQAVDLAATGSNNILVQPGLTDAFGVASGTIASITAETKTITATVNPGASQIVVAQQPTVDFVADPNNISAVLTSASASPATGVIADGSAVSTITVTVRDSNGNPVAGQAVALAASGSNNILVQPGLTDAFGVASGSIASITAEVKTITATVNPGASQIVVAQQPTVQFVGDANNISALLTTATAAPTLGVPTDGLSTSTITVTVRDVNGNPIAGQVVDLAATGSNNILVQPGLTDAFGVASGSIASITAEIKTITATVNPGASQVVVAQQPTVEFVANPAAISAVLTTATASPATGVIANGSAISTITVTVLDVNSNPVAGQAVQLASTGLNNILVQPGVTDAFGVASGTIASMTAETKTITATVNPGFSQVVVAQQPTVDFVGDPSSVSAVLTTATASPATGVIADGSAISTITVTVRDGNGNPLAGQVVQLSSTGSNNILAQPGVSDASGVASGTIASTMAEIKTITATVNPGALQVVVAQQPSVEFVADPNNISAVLTTASASPATGVIANGSAISTITVTVRDGNGNAVAGQAVQLAATGSNNTLVQPSLTDAFGVATGTIASTSAEIKTITATVNPGASQIVVAQQPTVQFVGDPNNISGVLTSASASPATGVLADGSAISTITVTVLDVNGNPVVGQAVDLAATGSNNILVQPGLTDAFGVASGTIASTTAETKTITATVNPGASQVVVAQQPTVDFVADPNNISAVLTTASASPATGVIADGSAISTITVTVRDQNGNPVAGQAVALAASGSNNILVQPGLTDAFGVASGTIASLTAETKTIIATVNPGASQVVVAQQPTVDFVGDPSTINALLSSATAAPALGVLADGSAISTITVTVRDSNGNPVAGQAVDLAASGSNNILVQPGLTDAFGVASGTIASTSAEIKTITATVNPGASQVVVAQQPTVEFVGDPNSISASLSSSSASPANGVIANGTSVSTITITVLDVNGNPVVGQVVQLSSSGSNNILVQPGVTDPFGVATGTIASTTAETKVITVTVNPGAGEVVLVQQPSVTFVADPNNISAVLTTATASPASGVIADGLAISTITVTVRDQNGNPVAGQAVDLAASGSNNTLVQPGLTDAFGVASGTIASITAELKTITATVNPGASQVVVAQQPTVDFVGDPSTISVALTTASASPATGVIANGSAISTITVTVRDINGNGVVGQIVELAATGSNNALVQPGLTDAFGVASGTIASITAETKTITATVNPGPGQLVVAQQPTVDFVADPSNISATLSTLSASPANGVIADGSAISTITITVLDANGNPVAGQVVQLSSSGSNNILVQPGVTDPFGVATGTIASTSAETKIITATVNPGAGEVVLAQQPAVTFVGDPNNISGILTTATASPAIGVIADGSAVSTITVTVRDINGNPVAGQAVDLAATGSNNTLVQPGVTDASGVASGTIASITAEIKTISATVNPGASQIAVAQQPTVEFIGDPNNISAILSSISASPTNGVLANGSEVSTITITVRDSNGNPVVGQVVELSSSGSNNILVQPGVTDPFGVATGTIASLSAETKIITATAGQVVLAQQPSVTFVPDPNNISAVLTTAVASPATGVIADGSAISTITVTVRDINGNPVPGQVVDLASTGSNNTLVQPGLTDALGVASGTIASLTAELKTITATVNPGASQVVVAQQPTVDFVGDPSTITALLSTASAAPAVGVIANGVEISTITVTVRDINGNGVVGQIVELAATGSNNTLVQPGLTDAFGVAIGTIASITAETKAITATVNPGASQIVVAQQPTVEFIGDPNNISAVLTSASASPATGVIADGSAVSTITVTVRDSNGNPVAGQAVALAASGSNNILVQPGLTDAFGVASGSIASITAEVKTITATVNPGASEIVVAQQPTVQFVGDASNISALLTTASASPESGVIANGVAVSTITVTVRDINGNPVAGQAVDLAATGINNTLVQPGLTDASGVASGTIASITAEIKTITATINPGASQIVVAQQPTVGFIGDPSTISAVLTSASALPAAGVIANGTAVSTITVTVRDQNGNGVAGQAVSLAASGSNNTLVQPGVTDAFGVASGTIASITAETKVITATVNPGAGQVVVAQQPSVEFIPDASNISATLTTAIASPATGVIANGSAISTITVTVRDQNGNPVPNQAVSLASTGSNNTLVQPSLTNASGVASGTIASITAETKVIIATVNPGAGQVVVAQQPTVEFVGDPSTITPALATATASPATGVIANGSAASTITVTVRDVNGNGVAAQAVSLAATGSFNILVQPGVTNASGVATGTIASIMAETKTITATVNPGASQFVVPQQPTVEFVGDANNISAILSTASASPTSGLIANGTDTSMVTVTVRDVNGNPIAGQVVQLSSSGSNNTFVQPGVTNAFGIATGTIASIRAETKTLTATVNPGASQVVVSQHPTVTFDPDANNLSATLSTATASPASGVIANGSAISTITVTVRDINGNPVPGQAVSLAATGSNNTLVQPSGLTNASGVASGTIASIMAETKTITATINPGASQILVAQQPTVVFVGDPNTIQATLSTATASPATGVIANGTAISTITVTIRDINNNPVVGQVVQLAATGSNNTLVQPGLTNSSGVATGTIRSIRAETKTITATINPGAGQIVVPQQPTVEFVADPNNISAGLSTVTASPNNNVLANGTTTSTITVTVRDINGNLVSGRPVQLSSTGTNNIFVQPAVTNSSGVTTGTIASTTAQLKTLTATINPGAGQVVLSQHPTVDFVSALISASLSTAVANPAFGVAADGVAFSTITITVRSTTNTLVSGMNVTFTATGAGNTLVQPASPTNASGVTTGTIRSTVAETKTITVTMNPGPSQIVLTMQPTVTFVNVNSQIYYVRTGGNDSNNGRTPAAAWQTLQKAANTLVPGDRVYVGRGTYNGTVIENTSGTATNPILYIADTRGAWTGDGAGAVVVSGGSQGFNITGSYITIDGFTLINNANEAISVTAGCLGIVVRNCTLYNNGTGIDVGAGGSTIIEHNVLSNHTDNGSAAIYLDSAQSLVRNNLIYNNAGDGIYVGAGNCTVTNNTLYMNAAVQLRSPANGTVTASNNVIVNGLKTGIEVTAAGNFSSSYNLVWSNLSGDWVGLPMGPGDISTNPFLDDPDGWDNLLGGVWGADDRFHLNYSVPSPAFDAGSAAAKTFAFTDGSTLADRTSRTDFMLDGTASDSATVNMGYHYATTLPSLPDLLSNDGRLFYGVGSNPQPSVRTWNDLASSWSAEGLAAPAGSTIRWTVHQIAPLLTQQQLLGVLSDNGSATQLKLLQWSGTQWSLDWIATGIASSQSGKRGFDVAYEQTSGDALVVYSNNTNTPRYRTRTAGLWSAELALPVAPLSGVVQWVQLASRPGSNEIAVVYSDANADLAVLVWDGATWTAATSSVLETNLKTNVVTGAVSNRVFDLAYEASGELVVAWGRLGANGFRYSTKAAGSSIWTASNQVSQALTSVPHFIDLAAEPGTDRIAIAACGLGDGVERLGVATWNGNNWINRDEIDSQITNANETAVGDFPAAVAWLGTSGTAICVYADDQAGTLDWAQWTGGGWAVQGDFAIPGKGITESVELKTFASGNRVMLLLSDSNSDLFALWTDGTSWNTTNGGVALSTSLSSINTVPFSFAIKPQ